MAAVRVAATVLAAGAGRRMGMPKADLVVAGQRLLDRAVRTARAAGCAPVIAVVRPGTAVAGTEAAGARVVINPDPDRGMRSSLTLAVEAAGDADALAVLLVDAPGIGAEALRSVLAAWTPGRIAVGRYADRWGHPIVMAPELWRIAVAAAGPDEGARALLASRADLLDFVDVPGDPTDLDTPEDLGRWAP
jgi:CTP:molybdopterin cytidylyltransferase MocA